jgi:hypothetical protein
MDRNGSHVLLNPVFRETLRGFLLLVTREIGVILVAHGVRRALLPELRGVILGVLVWVLLRVDGVRLGIHVLSAEGPGAPV